MKDNLYKKFIGLIVIAFGLIGFSFLVGKKEWFPDWYRLSFMAGVAFLSAFLIILPKLIFSSIESQKQKTLLKLQTVIALSLSFNGLGGLGFFQLYKVGIPYDKILHFFTPFILILALVPFINFWYKTSFKSALISAFILIILAGFFWEFLEFTSDVILKTKSFGVYGDNIVEDTILDIFFNFIGLFAGIVILINQKK